MFARLIQWIKSILFSRPEKGRVFVGVSGGVDSSVSLALLKDQGYDVVGVFIRTWQPDFIECTWRHERRDAMRVCAHLNVPFMELNLEQAYKQGVADYMIAEYSRGRTPNPDVMCNKEVKFGAFFDWAQKQGAYAIATGHYAQVIDGKLFRGVDHAKDQSYFLWTLTPDQLKRVLFPVGGMPKSRVRELAQYYQIPVATKKDSQGICFIGEIDMKDFLSHYITQKRGAVVDESGRVIGHHQGTLFFTLGERHGFTITQKTPDDRPYYVVSKNIQTNTITVSQDPRKNEGIRTVTLEQVLWRVPYETLTRAKPYTAQIRYHGKKHEVDLVAPDQVRFHEYDYSLAAGQSVVLYDGEECIGGGIVVK